MLNAIPTLRLFSRAKCRERPDTPWKRRNRVFLDGSKICEAFAAMPKPARIETAARRLARRRLSSTPIDPTEDMRPDNEFEAYAFQAAVNRQLSQSGLGLPVGHKIGCATPVMQAYLGISNPCAGEIFAATVVERRGVVSRARYRRLGVECEIAVRLSRDAAVDRVPFRRESIASYVDAVTRSGETRG
jgi:2-keto-4-pentenoate hydratase